MNALYQAFTTALLHFVWQGAVVACLLSVALFVLRRQPARVRYVVCCAALAVMAVLPAVSTVVSYRVLDGSASALFAPAPEGIAFVAADGRPPAELSPAVSIDVLRDWAIPVWSLGVLLFSLRLLSAYGYVLRLRRRAAASDDATRALALRLAERMGMTRPFRVLVSSIADGPSVIGWLRPVILLPSATLLGLTPRQLEAVLAHELAHIRRYDYLVNLLQSIVEALLFYHPAVWWVSSCARRERELCCDDLAVAVSGDAVGYARALTILERQRRGGLRARPAMAASDGWLALRVQRLVGLVRSPDRPSVVPGILALVLGIGVLAFGMIGTDSFAQDADSAGDAPSVDAPRDAPAGPNTEELAQMLQELAQRLEALEEREPRLDDLNSVRPFAAPNIQVVSVDVPPSTVAAPLSSGWVDLNRLSYILRAMALGQDERAAVEALVESYREDVTAATEQVEAEDAELEELLGAESVDRSAVSAQLESLIEARAELERTSAMMILELREQLSFEQWVRLQRDVERSRGYGYAPAEYRVRTQGVVRGGGGRGGAGSSP